MTIVENRVPTAVPTNEEIFARETLWKEKLGTRVKGLNRN